jgi:hypothetical protein
MVYRSSNKITYLKDVKSSGTGGATIPQSAYITRELNTQEGDTTFCTLASNQFTLQPGTYDVEAFVPYWLNLSGTASVKAKIRNITSSSDAIIGQTSLFSNPLSQGSTNAFSNDVVGTITITVATTFAVQQYTTSTNANNGGMPMSIGDNEIYTIVKITKVK